AQTPCGQGPYDVHLVADGKTPEEGVEIVACTSHRLTGKVEIIANNASLITEPFGDVADNQRCLAGNATVVATQSGSATASSSSSAPGTAPATTTPPSLLEEPYS